MQTTHSHSWTRNGLVDFSFFLLSLSPWIRCTGAYVVRFPRDLHRFAFNVYFFDYYRHHYCILISLFLSLISYSIYLFICHVSRLVIIINMNHVFELFINHKQFRISLARAFRVLLSFVSEITWIDSCRCRSIAAVAACFVSIPWNVYVQLICERKRNENLL